MSNYTSFASPLQWHFWWHEFWGKTTQPALDNAFCNTFWQLFGTNFCEKLFCKKPEVEIPLLLRIRDDIQTQRSTFTVSTHTLSKALYLCTPLLWGTATPCWNRAGFAVTVVLPTSSAVATQGCWLTKSNPRHLCPCPRDQPCHVTPFRDWTNSILKAVEFLNSVLLLEGCFKILCLWGETSFPALLSVYSHLFLCQTSPLNLVDLFVPILRLPQVNL